MTALRESRAAPSTFATLLRRSKFASYDPSIAQIYTSYGGHAHRGNWGLKRPLALTKRGSQFITVKSVDSKEQQTEWYNAETPARWLKGTNEIHKQLGIVGFNSKWNDTLGMVKRSTFDSDYNIQPTHRKYGPFVRWSPRDKAWDVPEVNNRLTAAQRPNPESMSPNAMKRYLRRLRQLRPEFMETVSRERSSKENENATAKAKAHAKAKANSKTPQNPGSSDLLWETAMNRPHLVPLFLQEHADLHFSTVESTLLSPNPHLYAGMSYAELSDLTNRFLHHPVPGRILGGASAVGNGRRLGVDSLTVGVSGQIGFMTRNDASGQVAAKLTDTEGHKSPVYVISKSLAISDPPRVVGANPTYGFQSTKMQLELVNHDTVRTAMSNPYQPGTPAYIAHNDQATARHQQYRVAVSAMDSTARKNRIRQRYPARADVKKQGLLRTIGGMLDDPAAQNQTP